MALINKIRLRNGGCSRRCGELR